MRLKRERRVEKLEIAKQLYERGEKKNDNAIGKCWKRYGISNIVPCLLSLSRQFSHISEIQQLKPSTRELSSKWKALNSTLKEWRYSLRQTTYRTVVDIFLVHALNREKLVMCRKFTARKMGEGENVEMKNNSLENGGTEWSTHTRVIRFSYFQGKFMFRKWMSQPSDFDIILISIKIRLSACNVGFLIFSGFLRFLIALNSASWNVFSHRKLPFGLEQGFVW